MHSYLWRRHFQAYNDREWYITGLASLIVTIFGLMGNMTTCLVFIQQKMMDAFNQLLIALASIDILFLLFSSITSITITMQYDPGYEPGTYITLHTYAVTNLSWTITQKMLYVCRDFYFFCEIMPSS